MTYSCEGVEFLIDALGCEPERLRSLAILKALFAEITASTGLHAVGTAQWHQFGGAAGLTGIQMLSESHLACHTYPEAGYAAFSLYCCREGGVAWPWAERLRDILGADTVDVRMVRRGPRARAALTGS